MKLGQIIINQFRDDNVFNKYQNIRQIGIQGLPGLQFRLNEGGIINLNKTGIFELTSEFMFIYSLTFENNENNINKITNQTPVIVDIVYEDEKEEEAQWDSTVITIK